MIGAWTLDYPPRRFIGSELMTHELLKAIQQTGREVAVATSEPKRGPWAHEGVQVTNDLSGCNLLIVHADMPRVSWSRHIPCQIAICHNAEAGVKLALHNERFELVVCNSETMAAELRAREDHNYLVVRPPAPPPGRLSHGRMVTIVNLNENKAGKFWEIARAMPDVRFLAVRGGYGDQIVHRLPNVTIIGPVPHNLMWAKVWSKTALLLAPSARESWNMTAGEAIAHGIPVLASDIEGVRENLGTAALYLDPDASKKWVREIRRADRPCGRVRGRAAFNRTRYLADRQRFVEAVVTLGDRHDQTGINHHG